MNNARRKTAKSFIYLCSLIFALNTLPIYAQNEVIFQSDFEKGTQGWETRGERVSVKSSKDQAASGKKSLKVSKRNANWNGCQLNLTKTLSAGNVYKFTISVKLDEGETADEIKMTMQRGDDQFGGVGSASVSSDEWTTFSGNFNIPGTDPYLLIYVEAARPETSYYIDNFKIELVKDNTPEQTGILLQNDFEDSTAQNWLTRGDGVEIFSSTAGGSRSLKVANRTQNWHGLALDVSPKLFKGRTYQISASVKLVAGQSTDKLKIIMQQTPPGGKPTYVEIVPATKVTDAEWVTLEGEYKSTTDNNNLFILVETEGEKTSFYLDNFELKIPESKTF